MDLDQKFVLLVTSVSLIANLILTVFSTIFAFISISDATSAFAINSFIDFASCLIVFWRYYNPDFCYATDYSNQNLKETKACFYLGLVFIISSLLVIGKSLFDVLSKSPSNQCSELILLSSIAIGFCIILTILKFWLYNKTRCDSLFHDAVNTLINLLFAILMVLSSLMIENNENYWYLDPIGSLILALISLVYGLIVLVNNSIYTRQSKPILYTYLEIP